MKFVIQRVSHAEVCVEGEQISGIDKGLLVFVGVFQYSFRDSDPVGGGCVDIIS